MLRANFLGLIEFVRDETYVTGISTKAKWLATYLILQGEKYSRQTLEEKFWLDAQNPQNSFTKGWSELRRVSEAHFVAETSDGANHVYFDPAHPHKTDIAELEREVQQPYMQSLEEVKSIYRGDFAQAEVIPSDFAADFTAWIDQQKIHYREMLGKVLHRLAAMKAWHQCYADSDEILHYWLSRDTNNTEARRLMLTILAQRGQIQKMRELYQHWSGDESEAPTDPSLREFIQSLFDPHHASEALREAARLKSVMFQPFTAPSLASYPYLVGQTELVAKISNYLQPAPSYAIGPQAVRIVYLYGLGGIGKTTVAVYLAHTLREAFSDGVLWADLANSEPLDVLRHWATLYQLNFSRQLNRTEDLIEAFNQLCKGKRLLLILDNLKEDSDLHRYFLRSEFRGSIIVTRREKIIAPSALHQEYTLNFLSESDSLILLEAWLNREDTRLQNEPQASRDLCRFVGYLPLALQVVASFLREQPQMSIAEYLAELQAIGLAGLDPVQRVFERSWITLTNDEKKILTAISIFQTRSFAEKATASLLNDVTPMARLRLERLVRLSLLQGVGGSLPYQLHSLLALFARDKLPSVWEDPMLVPLRYIQYYLRYAHERVHAPHELVADWENLFEAVKLTVAQQNWLSSLEFAGYLRQPLSDLGRYSELKEVLNLAISAAAELLNVPREADLLSEIGLLHIEQSNYADAQSALENSDNRYRTLAMDGETAETLRGKAKVLYLMGRLYLERGDIEEAESPLEESYAIYEKLNDIEGMTEVRFLQCDYDFILRTPNALEHARQTAQELYQDSQRIVDVSRRAMLQIRATRLLAQAALLSGDYALCYEQCEAAVNACNEIGARAECAAVQDTQMQALYRLGLSDPARMAEALEVSRSVVAAFRAMGDKLSLARSLYSQMVIAAKLDNLALARQSGQESLRLFAMLNRRDEGGRCADFLAGLGNP